ncbi:hypothetical protein CSV79_13150 [Sporosarcina sp. P13]|uniref:hypothetical protein n=1 Tax=Sporosarcina sp. P13 TaxID=2048263 RepID=UPI000C16E3C4|nr:hypothetical protein [Sporosarcina sp. P13]PIC63156.1 hypothetical protein CSV79_13150 [Sporosarcina sp. P13]
MNRLELQEHEILSELLILRLRQNTNYLLSEDHGSHLRQLWYSKIPLTPQTIDNRFNALPPNGRIRGFNFYPDELKARVIFEHLFNNKTHRWLDINVLGLTDGKTKVRSSANILYYIGMKADYRGIFRGEELGEVIKIL